MLTTAVLLTLLSAIAAPAVAADAPVAPPCTVCHSKDPKMVRMHSALGFKDCFLCHGPAKELPVKERISERPTDQRCMSCHKG